MARIVYSSLVNSVNGTIRGTTFQRNQYGMTIKGKPHIVNPSTIPQVQRKLAVQAASKAWATIGATQRGYWNDYATAYPVPTRLNPDANLNGFNYFLRWRLTALAAGYTSIPSGPFSAPVDIEFLEEEVIFVSPGVAEYIGSFLTPSVNWQLLCELSAPGPASRTSLRFTPRVIDSLYPGDDAGGGEVFWALPVAADYVALFGTVPAPGDMVNVAIRLFRRDRPQVFVVPSHLVEVIS